MAKEYARVFSQDLMKGEHHIMGGAYEQKTKRDTRGGGYAVR